MDRSIAEFADVVKDIQHTLRCGAFILQPSKNIGLSFGDLEVNTNHRGMAPSKAFTKLAKLYETRAGVILKIALGQPAKIGKLPVQMIQKLKIATRLIHHTICA
jgi:hypothetical protein